MEQINESIKESIIESIIESSNESMLSRLNTKLTKKNLIYFAIICVACYLIYHTYVNTEFDSSDDDEGSGDNEENKKLINFEKVKKHKKQIVYNRKHKNSVVFKNDIDQTREITPESQIVFDMHDLDTYSTPNTLDSLTPETQHSNIKLKTLPPTIVDDLTKIEQINMINNNNSNNSIIKDNNSIIKDNNSYFDPLGNE